MHRALFLDRDGVVNVDYGHVYKIEDFRFVDGIIELCRRYQEEGYLIVIVSNQAGIAKGMYTLEDLKIIDKYMKDEFKKNGVVVTASYYCPHHPDEHCSCRKPEPGLLFKAKEELDISLEDSVLIGDKMSDLIAGHRAGIKKLYFKKSRYEETKVDFEYEHINF